MSRSLFVVLLAVACTSPEPTPVVEPPTTPTTPTEPGGPPPFPEPPDTAERGVAGLTFVYQGVAVADELVIVHALDGTELARRATDRQGRLVVTEIPEEGVGVTFDSWLLDEVPGLTTIYGIHAGDVRTFGTAAPDPIRVSFTLSNAFAPGASSFRVQAGCGSDTVDAVGDHGEFVVDRSCLPEGLLDVWVVAYDGEQRPVAWARARDVQVEASEDDASAFVDFGLVPWSVEFDSIALHSESYGGVQSLQAWAPNRPQRATTITDTFVLEPFEMAVTDLTVIPETGTAEVRQFVEERRLDLNEVRFGQWAVHHPRSRGGALSIDENFPGWLGELDVDEATRSVGVTASDAFRCGDRTGPVASALIVQGERDGEAFNWQILHPGSLPDRVFVPTFGNDPWPSAWGGVRIVVQEGAQTGQSYDALLTAPSPVQELEAPAVALGQTHCRRGLSRN